MCPTCGPLGPRVSVSLSASAPLQFKIEISWLVVALGCSRKLFALTNGFKTKLPGRSGQNQTWPQTTPRIHKQASISLDPLGSFPLISGLRF